MQRAFNSNGLNPNTVLDCYLCNKLKTMDWHNLSELDSHEFKCGNCGREIASKEGYFATDKRYSDHREMSTEIVANVYICHKCRYPNYFDELCVQIPGALLGNPVKHISDNSVSELFDEAKRCHSAAAFTASVMCCRKLLMNLSVAKEAETNKSFAYYVKYLEDNNYLPPDSKHWVDSIRVLGNEANHEINPKTSDESKRIIVFTEMLLRFIYELPGMMKEPVEE
jgi:hypothetical protein